MIPSHSLSKTPIIQIEEPRYIDLGRSESGRVLVVSYAESGAKIRIISCRRASRSEGRRYEEGTA
ncbi:MAG: BrnT family toxin [Acidobacteriota bacterium]